MRPCGGSDGSDLAEAEVHAEIQLRMGANDPRLSGDCSDVSE